MAPRPISGRVGLPEGFEGKHISDGSCLDCGGAASVYRWDDHQMLVVHQGKGCGGFQKRFSKQPDSMGVTMACDESGVFVEEPGPTVASSVPTQARRLADRAGSDRNGDVIPRAVSRTPNKES